MAYLKFDNIRIAGLSAAVPKNVVNNINNTYFPAKDVEAFIATTGVARHRAAAPDVCTSDLALVAAQKLMTDLKWDPSEIDLLVFISQGPDYILPNTATILQDKLKLPKSCIAFDMTLGCSAYIYGLSTVAAYMSSGASKRALFLCGDTPNKNVNTKDPSTAMLFGDAGTATALEYDTENGGMYFGLGSDGSGYASIMVPVGGARNIYNEHSLTEKVGADGIVRNGTHLVLDGMNVFSFGISTAPASVKETAAHFGYELPNIDYFVFHQANMMMNEMIRKKLKLAKEKVPYSLADYGNTSSASIPVTMITEIREQLTGGEQTLLLCGFGVGLSWGSCIVKTKNLVIPEIIEI